MGGIQTGRKEEKGVFAQVYRKLFIAENEAIGWVENQRALVEMREKGNLDNDAVCHRAGYRHRELDVPIAVASGAVLYFQPPRPRG
ncbi:MAG: hypothetical protein M3P12_12295 [Gemmatimonadota bacterium]|nr:hypothetical protein [Gemmatimonadota bacterium]